MSLGRGDGERPVRYDYVGLAVGGSKSHIQAMLTWLMIIGIFALVLFITSCRRGGPVWRHISLGLLSVAGASLLLAGLGFAFSGPFPVSDISLDAMEASRAGQARGIMATMLNLFISIGPEGNAAVWGGLGAICLRCAWTGSWDRFAALVRQVGR